MRAPRDKIFITCAVTGNLTTPEQTPHLPITPEQIADACLGAAEAGAAIAHIHVRDPGTGKPSMEIGYYRDVVERIRAKNTQLILNITTGPGGRFVPSPDDPKIAAPGTTLMNPEKRAEHIALLRPEICTIDLNTMNSGKEVVINTPGNVRRMAKMMREAGAKPEIELFDSGDIALMHDLLRDGTFDGPVLCSFVMGVRYGLQPSPETVLLRAQPASRRCAIYRDRHRQIGLHRGGAVLPRRRTRPGRAGGRGPAVARPVRDLECGDGREGAADRGRSGRPDRHAARGARDHRTADAARRRCAGGLMGFREEVASRLLALSRHRPGIAHRPAAGFDQGDKTLDHVVEQRRLFEVEHMA